MIKEKKEEGRCKSSMAKWSIIVMTFLFLIVMNSLSVSSAQETSQGEYGLEMDFPPFSSGTYGNNITFPFELYNKYDGHPINTGLVCCDFKLIDHNGDSIYGINKCLSDGNNTLHYHVSSGNFSYEGNYAFSISCNGTISEYHTSSDAEVVIPVSRGGFKTQPFVMLASGYVMDSDNSFLYGFLISVCLIFMITLVVIGRSVESGNMYSVDGKYVQIEYGKYLKFTMYYLSYLSFIVLNFMIYDLTRNTIITSVRELFQTFFWMSISLLFPITIAITVKVSMDFFKDLKELNKMKEGMNVLGSRKR